MAIEANIGEAVQIPFTVIDCDGSPFAGAGDGDFAKLVYLGSVDAGVSETVTETAQSGFYHFEFTPTAAGLHVARAIHSATGFIYECQVDVSVRAEAHVNPVVATSGTAHVEAWLSRNGRQVTTTTSATVTLYDASGTVVFGPVTVNSSDARGYVTLTGPITLTDNRPYGAVVSCTDPSDTVVTNHGFVAVSG